MLPDEFIIPAKVDQSITKSTHFTTDMEGRIICPKCLKSYKTKGAAVRHLKYECGLKGLFQCQICKKHFKHKSHVKDHLKVIHNIWS